MDGKIKTKKKLVLFVDYIFYFHLESHCFFFDVVKMHFSNTPSSTGVKMCNWNIFTQKFIV